MGLYSMTGPLPPLLHWRRAGWRLLHSQAASMRQGKAFRRLPVAAGQSHPRHSRPPLISSGEHAAGPEDQ